MAAHRVPHRATPFTISSARARVAQPQPIGCPEGLSVRVQVQVWLVEFSVRRPAGRVVHPTGRQDPGSRAAQRRGRSGRERQCRQRRQFDQQRQGRRRQFHQCERRQRQRRQPSQLLQQPAGMGLTAPELGKQRPHRRWKSIQQRIYELILSWRSRHGRLQLLRRLGEPVDPTTPGAPSPGRPWAPSWEAPGRLRGPCITPTVRAETFITRTMSST